MQELLLRQDPSHYNYNIDYNHHYNHHYDYDNDFNYEYNNAIGLLHKQ